MEVYKVESPLVKNGNAFFKAVILVDNLTSDYQKYLGIDVIKYFSDKKEIYIYECEKTNYQFYYPFGIEGDHLLYETLSKIDWYYMPWKWEHEITKRLLEGGEKILEIGSGGLGFIERIKKLGFDITGLELNEKSVSQAKELNLKVYNESIQDHSKKNVEEYDLICSYQVLEHVTAVHSFIEAQVDGLKMGGKLIISVPNNDSFIKLTKGGILNMPPHHMGLWDKKSLKNLTRIFNLKVQKIYYEPLQAYHFDWYIDSIIQYRGNYLTRVIFQKLLSRKLLKFVISKFYKFIHGHTIMVVYTKC